MTVGEGRGQAAGPEGARGVVGAAGVAGVAGVRVAGAADFGAWSARVARIGGCANPTHLRGSTRIMDGSGRVVEEFGGSKEAAKAFEAKGIKAQ